MVVLVSGLPSCSPAKECVGPAAPLIVCVEVEDLGGLVAKVGPARLTEADMAPGGANSWAEHEVQLLNRGNELVHLDDNRTSVFVGENDVLLVATPGCGYGGSPVEKVRAGLCDEDFRPESLAPGEALSFVFTAWRDLRGMGDLTAGQYVFPWPVRYSYPGPFPRRGPPREVTGTVRLYYRVTDGSGATGSTAYPVPPAASRAPAAARLGRTTISESVSPAVGVSVGTPDACRRSLSAISV